VVNGLQAADLPAHVVDRQPYLVQLVYVTHPTDGIGSLDYAFQSLGMISGLFPIELDVFKDVAGFRRLDGPQERLSGQPAKTTAICLLPLPSWRDASGPRLVALY
jgi:hypothetical protein